MSRDDAADFCVRYALPVRSGKKLQDFSGVRQISIDGKKLNEAEISGGLSKKLDDAYKSYSWARPISGGASLAVHVEAVSLKELSDSEVWGNAHATYKGAELTLDVRIPEATYGMRSLTATEAVQVYDKLDHTGAAWVIDGPILPRESVVLWWRVAEDDGLAPGSEPPPASTVQGDDQA